jgi:hypothetical protein
MRIIRSLALLATIAWLAACGTAYARDVRAEGKTSDVRTPERHAGQGGAPVGPGISADTFITAQARQAVPSPRLAVLASVAVSPNSVTGGTQAVVTLTLSEVAPSDVPILLSSDNPAVVPVPATITIQAGLAGLHFPVTTNPVPLADERRPGQAGVGLGGLSVTISASQNVRTPTGGAGGSPLGGSTVGGIRTVTTTLTVVPPVVAGIVGPPPLPFSLLPCGGHPNFSTTGGVPTSVCVWLTGPAANERGLFERSFFGGAGVELSSSNSQVAAVPPNAVIPIGKIAATFPVTSVPVPSASQVVISANRTRTDTKTVGLTVLPPVLQDLNLTVQPPCTEGQNPCITGGNNATGSVILTGPAYQGLMVHLESSAPGTAAVPSSVPFQANSSSAPFNISTTPVPTDQPVTITATFGGVSKSAVLIVWAPQPVTVPLNPPIVTGPASSTGWVYMHGPAPAGGIQVALSSSDTSVATVPASVAVAGNATNSASFTVSAMKVTHESHVNITATYAGRSAVGILTVEPAPSPHLYIYTVIYEDSGGNPIDPGAALSGAPPGTSEQLKMCVNVVNGGNGPAVASTLQVQMHNSTTNQFTTWLIPVPSLGPGTGAVVCTPVFTVDNSGTAWDFSGCVDLYNQDNSQSCGINLGGLGPF